MPILSRQLQKDCTSAESFSACEWLVYVNVFSCGPRVPGSNPTYCFTFRPFVYPSSPWGTRLWLKVLEVEMVFGSFLSVSSICVGAIEGTGVGTARSIQCWPGVQVVWLREWGSHCGLTAVVCQQQGHAALLEWLASFPDSPAFHVWMEWNGSLKRNVVSLVSWGKRFWWRKLYCVRRNMFTHQYLVTPTPRITASPWQPVVKGRWCIVGCIIR